MIFDNTTLKDVPMGSVDTVLSQSSDRFNQLPRWSFSEKIVIVYLQSANVLVKIWKVLYFIGIDFLIALFMMPNSMHAALLYCGMFFLGLRVGVGL